MIWLFSILFRLSMYYAPIERQFHADTLLEYVTVVDRGSGTETAVLPCKLVLDDPTYSDRVDLRWYISKPDDASNPEQAVYQWTEYYDGKLGYGDDRFTRDSNNDEESYYLKIADVKITDEGRYCCDLNVNSDPRDVYCLDLHYTYFNPSNFKMSCDGDSTETSGIPLPATVTAEITDYAPAEDDAARELTIYDADNPTDNTKTTNYTSFGNGRYSISGTFQVTEPGLQAFTASLSYKWGNFEEKTIECTYIPGQFHADTRLEFLTVVDRGSGTETTVLPFKLVLDDPSYVIKLVTLGSLFIGFIVFSVLTAVIKIRLENSTNERAPSTFLQQAQGEEFHLD